MQQLYKILVASIFFFAPLGQAARYHLGAQVAPHIIFTGLAFFLGLILARRIIKPHMSIVVYVLLMMYLFFVTAFAAHITGYADLGLNETVRSLLIIVPALLASLIIIRDARFTEIKLYVKAFVLGVGISVLIAFYLFYQGEVFWGGRIASTPDQNPAIFGAYISAALIFVLGFQEKLNLSRVTQLMVVPALVVALVMTQARNSILSIIVGGLIAVVLVHRNWLPSPRRITIAAGLVFILAAVVFFSISRGLIPEQYYARLLLTLTTDDAHLLTAGRTSIWANYLDWGISAFGHGIESDAYTALSDGRWIGMSTHNSYLAVLVAGGGVGLLALLMLYGAIVYRSLRTAPQIRFGMVWLAFFLALIAIGNDTYNNAVFWIPFALWAFLEINDREARTMLRVRGNSSGSSGLGFNRSTHTKPGRAINISPDRIKFADD